jgi:hypothetical protein
LRLIIIMTVVGIISCLLLLIGAVVGYAIDDDIGLPIGMAVMCIFISVILRSYREISFILSVVLFGRKKQSRAVTGRNDTKTTSGIIIDFDKSLGIQKHPLVRVVFYLLIVSAIVAGFAIHHDRTYNKISSMCRDAHSASLFVQRKLFLQQAREIPRFGLFISGKTWMGRDPIRSCEEVQDELDRLLVWGECSEYLLEDVPCRCGDVDWFPDNPPEKCTRSGSNNPRCVEDWETRKLKIKC